LCVLEQLFLLKNWRQKLFLDIDYEERAAVRFERSASILAVVAG
jgi:hypothetical protein